MPNPNRREQLADELAELGVAAEASNPTGRKLEWNLIGRDDAHALADDLTGLSTAEVEAFLVGLRLGRATAPARTEPRRMREPHEHRRALIEHGRVEVEVDPADKDAVKRVRNGLFAHGYALGLKGRFGVTLEGDRLVAEASAGADDEALVEARERLAARAS